MSQSINETSVASSVQAESSVYTGTLADALATARERFTNRNPTSLKLHQEAVKQLPGGNTRSLLYTAPFPLYMKKGAGYKVFDEDGHE